MTKTTVIDFAKPSNFSPDLLTDLLRAGAQELLATAVRAEVSEFMAGHVHLQKRPLSELKQRFEREYKWHFFSYSQQLKL